MFVHFISPPKKLSEDKFLKKANSDEKLTASYAITFHSNFIIYKYYYNTEVGPRW